MRGFGFSKFTPNQIPKGGFEELLKLFLELLNYTSGDAGEALAWLNELDKQYNLTNDDYGMGDFIDELKSVRYWIDCGDDDPLSKGNSLLHIALMEKKVPHEFRIRDGGHNWTYWRTGITDALEFIGDSFRQK